MYNFFYQRWRQVVSDPWILKIISEGLRLQLVRQPPQSGVKFTNVKNSVHIMLNILEMVEKLYEKGAIECVPKDQRGQGYLLITAVSSQFRRRTEVYGQF